MVGERLNIHGRKSQASLDPGCVFGNEESRDAPRAEDADPGSLVRRRRRDSALP